MIKLHRGDALTVLRRLPDCSVQCCVTSPPYWGLRDYGTAKWSGGDAECGHTGAARRCDKDGRNDKQGTHKGSSSDSVSRDCVKCGARRIDRQLGLEPTPEAYVARMVDVFREVRRVMRDDGTLWLNMGDSYAGNGAVSQEQTNADIRHATCGNALAKCQRRIGTVGGLKPKDLCGIPWRLAFALQADGWYLRSDIIWHKPNPMPESVRDRPTKAHEYVFLLSKSERYFWDQEAVREPHCSASIERSKYDRTTDNTNKGKPTGKNRDDNGLIFGSGLNALPYMLHPAGRNLRSVWTITPKPFHGAHFATFPPALVERCIRAGTSERGCCPQCGKAWDRVTETQRAAYREVLDPKLAARVEMGLVSRKTGLAAPGWRKAQMASSSTLGFRPACSCPAAEPVPCVVLDPFIGSGTTAAVAKSLGRDCVGIDLNPKYLAMARARIRAAVPASLLATRHSQLATPTNG